MHGIITCVYVRVRETSCAIVWDISGEPKLSMMSATQELSLLCKSPVGVVWGSLKMLTTQCSCYVPDWNLLFIWDD